MRFYNICRIDLLKLLWYSDAICYQPISHADKETGAKMIFMNYLRAGVVPAGFSEKECTGVLP
jgi:hypothetical protein